MSNVQAFVGGGASVACQSIGAQAYATGNKVAFASNPDLHTAAHEAAHVIQQRGGVQLSGGVGKSGDTYEQHADAVADLVVQGKRAEGALDRFAGGTSSGALVQRSSDEGGVCRDISQLDLSQLNVPDSALNGSPSEILSYLNGAATVLRVGGLALEGLLGSAIGALGAILGIVFGPLAFLYARGRRRLDMEQLARLEGFLDTITGYRTSQTSSMAPFGQKGRGDADAWWKGLSREDKLRFGLGQASLYRAVGKSRYALYVLWGRVLCERAGRNDLGGLFGGRKHTTNPAYRLSDNTHHRIEYIKRKMNPDHGSDDRVRVLEVIRPEGLECI